MAVHASLRYDDGPEARQALHGMGLLSAKHLPAGRVVAVVDLDGCHRFMPDDAAKACRSWIPDRWAWVLTRPRRFDSVLPVKGRLGLWDLPEGLLQEVQA